MEDSKIVKNSQKIEYLVHKRHRAFRHLQKIMTKDGAYWLNCVRITKPLITKHLESLGKQEF